MWRAVFLSLGMTLILFGVECLFVDQFVIKKLSKPKHSVSNQYASPFQNASYQAPALNASSQQSKSGSPEYILFKPKEWMPWSLLAAGAVVVIYTFSLPGRSISVSEE